MWEVVSVIGYVVSCCAFYKLGQNVAWNYISKNYIAIHKSDIVGPILIKNAGGYNHGNKKNKSNGAHKKAFAQKQKHH